MNTSLAMNSTETDIRYQSAGKLVLWIAIVSIIMLFGGLTSAYIVRQADGNWLTFELPVMFYVSTAVILLSSVTMIGAVRSIRKNNVAGTRNALIATLLLGAAFVITQFMGWNDLVNQGIYFVGNPSGSFLYVITGLHVLHLAGGIVFMMIVTGRSMAGKYHSGNTTAIKNCATYWHFLDILWVYLFFFLLYVR
jgi:cytochrome c oxidase subunit III